jgi:hypothetical protein
MNRKLIAAAFAAVTLVVSAPVFARDWDGGGWNRHERVEAYHHEQARERADWRRDHARFAYRDGRDFARDRAFQRHERW